MNLRHDERLSRTKARATFNNGPRYRIGFFRKSIEDPA